MIELLEILKIRHIIYANFITPVKRAQNLYDFSNYDVDKEENQGGICLIMNIAHSSHGLNIIAATHIYFINPVKQESIEAQAIKRAHRIGQKKEVTVKTLYLKGVDELKILSKNEKLKNSKNNKDSFDAKEKEDNDNLLEFWILIILNMNTLLSPIQYLFFHKRIYSQRYRAKQFILIHLRSNYQLWNRKILTTSGVSYLEG